MTAAAAERGAVGASDTCAHHAPHYKSRQMTAIEWEDHCWYTCNRWLEVTDSGAPLAKAPTGWADAKAAKRCAQEEVVETLMVLNLPVLLGEDVRYLFRAGDYWGLQDISAIDPLGRIHLFELKKAGISGDVTEQLGHYLLSSLFRSAPHYAKWLRGLSEERIRGARWALYLAAAMANERTANIGLKYVEAHNRDESDRLTKGQWSELLKPREGEATTAAQDLLLDALRAAATTAGATVPTTPELLEWGERLASQLVPRAVEAPPVWVEPNCVIWVVGTHFHQAAEDSIRRWRGAGVDARALEVEARQAADGTWMIRVRRENFPERREVLSKVKANLTSALERVRQERTNDPAVLALRVNLYERIVPSKASKSKVAGGRPLRVGARAELVTLDIVPKVWRVWPQS